MQTIPVREPRLPQVFARPVPRGGLVLGGLAVVPGPEIRTPLWVLVLSKVLVTPRTERNLADLVALLAEHHELFLGVLRRALGFIKASEQLAAELNLPGR